MRVDRRHDLLRGEPPGQHPLAIEKYRDLANRAAEAWRDKDARNVGHLRSHLIIGEIADLLLVQSHLREKIALGEISHLLLAEGLAAARQHADGQAGGAELDDDRRIHARRKVAQRGISEAGDFRHRRIHVI